MLDGNSEDGYGRPLDGAIDGPAGNYAISLFGSQPPRMDAVTKRWKIRRDIEEATRQHTGRFTRVVLTLN